VQIACGIVTADRVPPRQQHRSGVESRVEPHDRDARFGVARENRALDRSRAAPARQQGSVDVHATEARQRQDLRRQDEAVRDDDEDIRRPVSELDAALRRFQTRGLRERQARVERE
jgi:hypothetical protein